MADEGAGNSNATNAGPGQAVSVRLIGYDKPFFTAIAIVLSLGAALFCYNVDVHEARRVYFTERCEAFIEMAATDHQPIPYAICGPREK